MDAGKDVGSWCGRKWQVDRSEFWGRSITGTHKPRDWTPRRFVVGSGFLRTIDDPKPPPPLVAGGTGEKKGFLTI